MFFRTRKRIAELEKTISQLKKELHSREKQIIKEDKEEKWTSLPWPFSKYEISDNDKVRNKRTKRLIRERRTKNGNKYFHLDLDNGSNTDARLNNLKSLSEGKANKAKKETRSRWKRIPEPFSQYQIRRDGKVRNIKTGNILKPIKGYKGKIMYNLDKKDGKTNSRGTITLDTLLEITYNGKKFKPRSKQYKSGQLVLPF